MQTLAEIRSLLDSYGLAPKKSLGQNFLIDHNLIRMLVETSGVQSGDFVLEIGPGTGTLTEELLARGCRVIACELDDGLAGLLSNRFAEAATDGRFTLIHADCLERKSAMNPRLREALGDAEFRLVANLPYGAASPLMVMLARDERCLGQYVTVQKEVAERVRAQSGTRDYSELSVLVQVCAVPKRIATLRPECFWPRPKVVSEMLAIEPRPVEERPSDQQYEALARVCRSLFTQRRKQIGAILGRSREFPPGIAADSRPEQLDIEDFRRLADWIRDG
ncbi:MAG: 16S rRNA (adenine(1518)-N(6)/adenine(1519)-N(6))-dimethyltransferase RsmA [Phycisphaerales bacterium JB065]